MDAENRLEYTLDRIRLPGNIYGYTSSSSRTAKAGGEMQTAGGVQVVLAGERLKDNLTMAINFEGRADGKETNVKGVTLYNNSGDAFEWILGPAQLSEAMQPFQKPLGDTIEKLNGMTDAEKRKSLEDVKGTLSIQWAGEYKITGIDLEAEIPKSTPQAIGNVSDLKDMGDVLPLNFEGKEKLHPMESGIVQLATWFSTSLKTIGPNLLIEPVLDLMASHDRKWFADSIATFMKTIPPETPSHREFVKQVWKPHRGCK